MGTIRAMPVLQVGDVKRSTAFYRRLGFAGEANWAADDEVFFSIVQRGDVTLGLQLLRAEKMPANTHWAAYIYVSDAEALREEFAAEKLDPTEMHRPTHYGCIDFDIVDPDGHRIAFGQALNPVPGPGLGEDRGRG